MAAKNEPYRFNYQALDKFLVQDYDPKLLGDQLDELMTDLVHVSKDEPDFGRSLSEHHYLLRKLRDLFWWQLPKNHNTNPQKS